jgi:hypothetical protein
VNRIDEFMKKKKLHLNYLGIPKIR